MRSPLHCNCGQRIFSRDVTQQGYHQRRFGPSYVYVRFRCSRCKRLGEHFIRQEDWEEGLLNEEVSEISQNERRRFEAMGKITVAEMADFHFKLEKLTSISPPRNEQSKR